MRVLLITNEDAVSEGLAMRLAPAGFIVDEAADAEAGIEACRATDYDVILLDLGRAAGEGLQRLRRAEVQVPVMVLGAQAIVPAFEPRADDVLAWPVQPAELAARIGVLVRRARSFCHPVIFTGRIKLNLAAKVAKVDGRPIALSAKEYAVLELLSLRKGRLISRLTLFDHLDDGTGDHSLEVVDRHVGDLRRKLAAVCEAEAYIHTHDCGGLTLREPHPEAGLIAA